MNATDELTNRALQTEISVSGKCARAIGKVFSPGPQEASLMLRELRQRYGWSQSQAAMVLGVSKSALSKWECGFRKPGGVAKKLIFFLHAHLNGKNLTPVEIATWGAGFQPTEV